MVLIMQDNEGTKVNLTTRRMISLILMVGALKPIKHVLHKQEKIYTQYE